MNPLRALDEVQIVSMAAVDGPPELEGITNFRDVGNTINEFLGSRQLRQGLFFRSARLEDATQEDRRLIIEDLGVGAVIDLRTKSEHLEQQKKHRGRLAAAVSHPLPDDARTQPLRIEGLTYHSIKVADGRKFQFNLLRQLSWWSLTKFMCLLVLGYRLEAINIISREVMLPRGLLGLGLDTLDWSGEEIRKVLLLYASQGTLPSIVHCSHGKDRTGLICALVLMILDVPIEAIEHDYNLTNDVPEEVYQERVKEFARIGLPAVWAGTDGKLITGLRDHLDEKHGGLEAYLHSIEIGKEEIYKIRENILY